MSSRRLSIIAGLVLGLIASWLVVNGAVSLSSASIGRI